jgi:MoaA/NifB/PqqE/SkfB family radical SAM enzyme
MHINNPSLNADPVVGLRFLWLELTNQCNLTCVHCYAESGPAPQRPDLLDTADFNRLLREAADIGCRAVQFIGGEPTLHRGLPGLIASARSLGYEHIEVYTNGTHLPPNLLACFKEHQVAVAVSVYADEPETHDAVTAKPGSHRRTIANLRRMAAAGLQLRAGIIAMAANQHRIDETIAFIKELGVENVRLDHVRHVGRGGGVADGEAGLQALCGACWQGSLCVAPDGTASPCIMSKAWPAGSVTASTLSEIITSPELLGARSLIRDRVWAPRQANAGNLSECSPDNKPPCAPELMCNPCLPLCTPTDPTRRP